MSMYVYMHSELKRVNKHVHTCHTSEFQAGIKWWLGIDSSQGANRSYSPSGPLGSSIVH